MSRVILKIVGEFKKKNQPGLLCFSPAWARVRLKRPAPPLDGVATFPLCCKLYRSAGRIAHCDARHGQRPGSRCARVLLPIVVVPRRQGGYTSNNAITSHSLPDTPKTRCSSVPSPVPLGTSTDDPSGPINPLYPLNPCSPHLTRRKSRWSRFHVLKRG